MFQPLPALMPYVSSIVVLESETGETETKIPFYADGCPGIMFEQTHNGVHLFPQNKKLDEFILYGQTVEPIELYMQGHYRLVVFCLYPYVAKPLFGVNPEEIVDDCVNLGPTARATVEALRKKTSAAEQVNILNQYLLGLIHSQQPVINTVVRTAIQTIIHAKGVISIKQLRDSLHVTERTFERHFATHIGISPKKFAQIVKFQVSLNQLTTEDRHLMSDIVYENGFADQSHFIRTFRKFSGKTPKGFKRAAVS